MEDGESGAERENEVASGDADIVAVGADDSIMWREFKGHKADNWIQGQGEEGHGEWAALLDTGGEENASASASLSISYCYCCRTSSGNFNVASSASSFTNFLFFLDGSAAAPSVPVRISRRSFTAAS